MTTFSEVLDDLRQNKGTFNSLMIGMSGFITEPEIDGLQRFGDEEVKQLAAALKDNHTLKTLNLSLNDGITDEGAFALAEMLRTNCALEILSLESTGIEDDGWEAITKAVEENGRSHILQLEYNTPETGASPFAERIRAAAERDQGNIAR